MYTYGSYIVKPQAHKIVLNINLISHQEQVLQALVDTHSTVAARIPTWEPLVR